MNHLRKAPLLPFCGWSPPRLQTTAVGSVKGQDIRMGRGEEGGAQRQQAPGPDLRSRMGQRQAGSAGFPTLQWGPISWKVLSLLWPGVMWLSYLASEIPTCRSEPQHTKGFCSVFVSENALSSGGSMRVARKLTQCTGLHLDRYFHNKKSL